MAYFNGDGLPMDRPLGLAWLTLASERDTPAALGLAGSAWGLSSPQERERAARLLDGLRSQYVDSVAASRAERRFERTLRTLQSNPVYGRGQCLPGAGLPPAAAADQAADGAGSCSMQADERYLASLRDRYEHQVAGWKQRIEMGTPEQLKNP